MEAEHQAQLDEFAAKVQTLEAEKQRRIRISHFEVTLKDTPLAGNGELVTLLAGLDTAVADKIVTQFKALSAQVDGNLAKPVGASTQEQADPQARIISEVAAYQATHKVGYKEAFTAVQRSKPELFEGVA
jgi:hypothetical protein